MADRKQFLAKVKFNSRLEEELQEAKEKKVTEEQLFEQRISFAFGNAPDSDLITKETVRRTSKKILLTA